MKLSCLVDVGDYNGTMGMKILNNNREVFSADANTLTNGTHNIVLDVEAGDITIKGFGKNKFDTLVDDKNNVIKDKYIDIKSMSFDLLELKKFHLCHSNKFFETYFSKNETKQFNLPEKEKLLVWYLQILEDHEFK